MGVFRSPSRTLPQSGCVARRTHSDKTRSMDGDLCDFRWFSLLPNVSRSEITINDRLRYGHCGSLSAGSRKSVLVYRIPAIGVVGLREVGTRAYVWAGPRAHFGADRLESTQNL